MSSDGFVCPKCGTPARTVIILKAKVRCEFLPNNKIGKVLSASSKGDSIIEFECMGRHKWKAVVECDQDINEGVL